MVWIISHRAMALSFGYGRMPRKKPTPLRNRPPHGSPREAGGTYGGGAIVNSGSVVGIRLVDNQGVETSKSGCGNRTRTASQVGARFPCPCECALFPCPCKIALNHAVEAIFRTPLRHSSPQSVWVVISVGTPIGINFSPRRGYTPHTMSYRTNLTAQIENALQQVLES